MRQVAQRIAIKYAASQGVKIAGIRSGNVKRWLNGVVGDLREIIDDIDRASSPEDVWAELTPEQEDWKHLDEQVDSDLLVEALDALERAYGNLK